MSWRGCSGHQLARPLPTWLLAATLGAAAQLSGSPGRRQSPPRGGGQGGLRQPGLACAHGEWWHRHGQERTWGTPTSAGRARCPHCLSTKARAGGLGSNGQRARRSPAGELGGGTVHLLCGHHQGCAPGSEDRGAAGAGARGAALPSAALRTGGRRGAQAEELQPAGAGLGGWAAVPPLQLVLPRVPGPGRARGSRRGLVWRKGQAPGAGVGQRLLSRPRG